MTKNLLITVIAFLALNSAKALEPTNMHADAAKIARVLLNQQLKECISNFQQLDVSIQEVKVTENDEATLYQVSGILLEGGDIVVGNARLLVTEKQVPAVFGFGTVSLYECKVEKHLF